MITITDIREVAARVYPNGYSLIDDYKRVNHKDGSSSKTGAKVYSLDDGKHWHKGKDLYDKLSAIADKMHV